MTRGSGPVDDRELDRLLARGRLSGPERERILDGALRTAAAADAAAGVASGERVPFWRSLRFAFMVPSLAAAAVLIFLVLPDGRGPGGQGGFTARGVSAPPAGDGAGRAGGGVTLELGCREEVATGAGQPSAAGAAGVTRCPRGGTLVFRASGARQGGLLAAFAEPASEGERIWYLPGSTGAFGQVAPAEAPQTLRTGARLPAAQPPGRYRVRLLLLDAPATREQLTALAADRGGPTGGRLRGAADAWLEVLP